MPLQNRVTPDGDIVAMSARGTMMGNRGGALHDADRQIRRFWASRQWIACRLEFNGRHRQVMAPGLYTELFFLDEATALAAGHRPCFECRRTDFMRFAELWGGLNGLGRRATAGAMDEVLHGERLDGRSKRVHAARLGDLPTGAMVRLPGGGPALVVINHARVMLRPWMAHGYSAAQIAEPDTGVDALTPPSTIAVIAAGYAPVLHPSA